MTSLLHIRDSEVESLLDVSKLSSELEAGFAEFSRGSAGSVVQPVRTVLNAGDDGSGRFMVMPVVHGSSQALACKLLTMYPNNTHHPTHSAIIAYYDSQHGQLRAILDGDHITAIRTAVASAIATKYLSSENSRTLAVIGTGVQARSHITVFKQLLPNLTQVRVWGRTESHASDISHQYGVQACSTIEECVKDADVIVTATLSSEPLLMAPWVKSTAHVNIVGASRPTTSELDPQIMRSAKIYADSREAVQTESGDVIKSQTKVYAEIGEVILGQAETHRDHLTVFKSGGMALEDAIAAKIVYEAHLRKTAEPPV